MFRFNNMLILKITKDCNLRCSYCYVHNKDNFKGQVIDFDVYKKIIQQVIEDRKKQGTLKNNFTLVFHGGEPLIVKKEYFAKLLEYARINFDLSGMNYSFGMQSNITLLDEEYTALLAKYDVGIGLSFDGIKDNNTERTKLDQNFFEEKFKLIQSYNINFGSLIVAGEHNVKNVWDSFEYLRDNYKQNQIKVNYVEDVNGVGGEVDGKTFFEYGWKPFFEDYIKTGEMKEGNCDLLLDKYLHYFFYGKVDNRITNCGSDVCGAGINIVEVEPTGDVYFCGRYSEEFEIARIQKFNDRDFLALNQIKRYVDFVVHKQKAILESGCDVCFAKNICDHGCMAFHYSKFQKFGIRKDLICDIYKSAHTYITKNIVRILATKATSSKEKMFKVGIGKEDMNKCMKRHSVIFNLLRNEDIVVRKKEGELIFEKQGK